MLAHTQLVFALLHCTDENWLNDWMIFFHFNQLFVTVDWIWKNQSSIVNQNCKCASVACMVLVRTFKITAVVEKSCGTDTCLSHCKTA